MRHRILPSFFTINAVQSVRCAVLAALLLSLLGSTGVIRSQVPYNSLEDGYTQNFDSLPATGSSFTWIDNSTLLGWYAANSGSTPFNPAGVSTGSTTSGNLYSFGSTSASIGRIIPLLDDARRGRNEKGAPKKPAALVNG